MSEQEKRLESIGSGHKGLMVFLTSVRRVFGWAFSLAQAGDQHDTAKVF